jgi:hypothetical protein
MVGFWGEFFASEGNSPEFLMAASRHVALDPPTNRHGHLKKLQDWLRKDREQKRLLSMREEERLREERESRGLVCNLCGNSGWVIVPLYKIDHRPSLPVIEDGVWQKPHYTTGVICRCVVGQSVLRCSNPDKRSMQLEEYEKCFSYWRECMAQKRDMDKRSALAMSTALDLDKKHGSIKKGGVKSLATVIGEVLKG